MTGFHAALRQQNFSGCSISNAASARSTKSMGPVWAQTGLAVVRHANLDIAGFGATNRMTGPSAKRLWRFSDELTKPTFMAICPSDGSVGRSGHY